MSSPAHDVPGRNTYEKKRDSSMPGFLAFCWGVTILCVAISSIVFFALCNMAESAVQESTAALISLTIAVIPFIFTKCIEAIYSWNK